MATDIDRLFRESLDQMEMTPSAAAWDQVQSQISAKKSPWVLIYRVAAAITLLLAASWIFISYKYENTETGAIAFIDKPEQQFFQYEWEIPSFIKSDQTESIETVKVKKVLKETTEIITDSPAAFQMIALESIKTTNWNPENQVSFDLNTKPVFQEENSIKITYLATASADTVKTNKLNEIIAFLKNESPTELLADIRDLKDNFLNKN